MALTTMNNMFEFRCRYWVCNAHFLIKEHPRASTGSCLYCGSHSWHIRETNITAKEYFKCKLKDPEGTIGYHAGKIIV